MPGICLPWSAACGVCGVSPQLFSKTRDCDCETAPDVSPILHLIVYESVTLAIEYYDHLFRRKNREYGSERTLGDAIEGVLHVRPHFQIEK